MKYTISRFMLLLRPCIRCERAQLSTAATADLDPPRKNVVLEGEEQKFKRKNKNEGRAKKPKLTKAARAKLSKERWLDSLTSPLASATESNKQNSSCNGDKNDIDVDINSELLSFGALSLQPGTHSAVVIGIDPDFQGALALLRREENEELPAVEVYDVPTLKVVIGGKTRSRPDTRAIVSLLQNLQVPQGTVAYIENSVPRHTDGKQSWWSSGFGFGVWIGCLMASGISVVPVLPSAWKAAMRLSGGVANKEYSRMLASRWFPSVAPQLQRKMDHGRAEAVLIAAFGKGLVPPGELNDIQTPQILEQPGDDSATEQTGKAGDCTETST